MSQRPIVWVPAVPSAYNTGMKAWIPTHDITPAEKFGEVRVMLPPNAARAGPAPCIAAMREQLVDFDAERDYLLSIGSPTLFTALGILAHKQSPTGIIRLLKWEAKLFDYTPVEMML